MNSQTEIHMTAPGDVYRGRRAKLAAELKRPLVIFAGHAPARNYPTNPHPFRAGSSYLYFGGPPIENAALLIEPAGNGDEGCTLLRPTPGPDDALWEGPPIADEIITDAAGLRRGGLVDIGHLGKLLAAREAAAIVPPASRTLANAASLGLQEPASEELLAVVNLRLIKDEHELRAMRHAARVAMDAHRAAMAATRPGRREADAAAALVAVLTAEQCEPSFTPIVTIRGEVLHGHGHPNVMPAGSLLVIDAGAEEPVPALSRLAASGRRRNASFTRSSIGPVGKPRRRACPAGVTGRSTTWPPA